MCGWRPAAAIAVALAAVTASCGHNPSATTDEALSRCDDDLGAPGYGYDPNLDPPGGSTYYGTEGDDIVILTSYPVTFHGLGGDDLICINDVGHENGPGEVVVYGGDGVDHVLNSAGWPLRIDGGPSVDVWYGTNQAFGTPGLPQRWLNLVGKASDPDGIESISYTLNGGPEVALGVGPDDRRLANPGDFNVDLLVAELEAGPNAVRITVVDGPGESSSVVVTVEVESESPWPLPYAPELPIDSPPHDVGQVVDGKWEVSGGLLSTVDSEIGYDRLVSLGDVSWTDYEATFTMRVNELADPTGPESGEPAAGLLMRWNGHNVDGAGDQPQHGYLPNGTAEPTPFGALGWWRNDTDGGGLELLGHRAVVRSADEAFELTLGQTYRVRARVVTGPSGDSTYSFRMWEDGSPEPLSWSAEFVAGTNDFEPASGALVLLAHEADVDFGDVVVQPVANGSPADGEALPRSRESGSQRPRASNAE